MFSAILDRIPHNQEVNVRFNIYTLEYKLLSFDCGFMKLCLHISGKVFLMGLELVVKFINEVGRIIDLINDFKAYARFNPTSKVC